MEADHLSATFAALADPTRRAILARLSEGEATVTELAAPFALSLPTISNHLRVLRQAGLVRQGRKAQWRPYRLEPERLKEIDAWMAKYRRHWEVSFDRLDEYLNQLQGKGEEHGRTG
jgi:DNA-binding transcriptional ArsR family regulator